MSYPIYKISIPNERTILHFCLDGEMIENSENDKCMNMYIYEDDTLVEVINKIKIGILNTIEDYRTEKFENIAGYLTSDWKYYDDLFKLKEYVYLIILKDNCTIEILNEKLKKINKIYDGSIDEINITNDNIDFNKIKSINEQTDIVIGYYDRFMNDLYYITKNEMDINIERIVENELNKPINSYYNIINNEIINIREYSFHIVKNEAFIKNNYISIPNYLSSLGTKNILESIYSNNNENRIKLDSSLTNKFCNDMIDNISYLSLEIHNYEKIDFKSKYNLIDLTEEIPFCLISQKDGTKISKKYKLLKQNKIPFIKRDKLNEFIEEKISYKNFVLFKIYLFKNMKKTRDFINVYLIDENYFYIKFNNINQKIKLDTIIENINNILRLLKLRIADKSEITMDDFHYYNDNNTIKLNDPNNFNSSKINLLIKGNHIKGSEFESHKFLYFISIFNTFFDIELQDPLNAQITKEIQIKKESKIVTEIKTVTKINTEGGIKRIKYDKKNYNLDEISNLKIINKKKIKLIYKKSYNYDSYNYIHKFFKYVVSFKEKDVKTDFKCNDTVNYHNFLINYGEDSLNATKMLIDINGTQKSTGDLIDEMKMKTINKLISGPFCDNIKKQTKKKCSITINSISGGVFFMDLENIYSLKDLYNICKLFKMYIIYSNQYNSRFNFKSSERLLLSPINPYIEKENNVYNIYNCIFNNYNISKQLNINSQKAYYIYSIYQNFITNTRVVEDDDDFLFENEFSENSESDSEDSQLDSDDEDDIEHFEYKNINEYLIKYNTVDGVLWENIMKKYVTTTKSINMICEKNRRPSVIDGDYLKSILTNEDKNRIKIKSGKQVQIVKPFTDLFEFENNNIILEKFNKEPINIYMGREYTINIKNEPYYEKKVLLLEDSNTFINEYNETDVDSSIYLEIKDKQSENLISLDEYLESEESEFNFIINFPLTEFNQENVDSKLKINGNYKFGMCVNSKCIEKIFEKNEQKINLHMPHKYYYDEKKYNDNYFIYLPRAKNLSGENIYDPRIKDNILCFYHPTKSQTDAPSVYNNLDANKNKPIDTKQNIDWDEENFYLSKFKIGKIPESIYENICLFLTLENKNIEYNKSKLLSQQPYRFGIHKNTNINNFLHCILIINKISLTGQLTPKIKKIFGLENNEKSIQFGIVREGIIKCIKDVEILNDEALIKLNNNVFYKNEKIKNLLKIIKLDAKKTVSGSFIPKSSLEEIRNSMSDYIQSSFLNMDIYFIWNLCSIIFNINIIIFELKFQGNTLKNNIKCPLVNNYKLYEFQKERKTCFILKFDNTYQPITIPTGSPGGGFIYNILFDINENSSFTNLTNLFNKCLLRYNNNSYDTLLINSIYHKIDYTDNILINTEDIYKIRNNIKYIIINEDYIKLGIVFDINGEYLFIPINYLKHNINYTVINDYIEYRYIYSNDGKQFIHNFDKTQELIQEFLKIHKNEKLQLNNKYITKNDNIIGIGLFTGDFIPINSINIDKVKLNSTNELIDILIDEDISYINQEENLEKNLENYNRFEYTNLYYSQFIYSVLHIIQEKNNKININNLLIKEEGEDENKKIKELINYIKDIFGINFKISDKMYLDSKKPTYDLESEIISCHTLQKSECNNNINCFSDSGDCKYIITQEYYDLFIKFLANDLYYNYYKRNFLLSIQKNTKISNIDINKYIVFEEDKSKLEMKNKINKIYNKVITDDHYYSIGQNYNKSQDIQNTQNTQNINKNYCRIEKFNETLNITYYAMKSLSKKNIISYSNCIYYNLSQIHNKKVIELRTDIANNIVNNIKDAKLNLHDIINYYLEHNDSHLYTNIKTPEELFNILKSSDHWMTEFDLYIYSQLYKTKILFYKLNTTKLIDYEEGCYMVMNKDITDLDEIKIYVEDFYYRKLYYLIRTH